MDHSTTQSASVGDEKDKKDTKSVDKKPVSLSGSASNGNDQKSTAATAASGGGAAGEASAPLASLASLASLVGLDSLNLGEISCMAQVVVVADVDSKCTASLVQELIRSSGMSETVIVTPSVGQCPQLAANQVVVPQREFHKWLREYRTKWRTIVEPTASFRQEWLTEQLTKRPFTERDAIGVEFRKLKADMMREKGIVLVFWDEQSDLSGGGEDGDGGDDVEMAGFLNNSRHYGTRLVRVMSSAKEIVAHNDPWGIDYVIVDPRIRPLSSAIDAETLGSVGTTDFWEELVVDARAKNSHWLAYHRMSKHPNHSLLKYPLAS